MKSIAVQEEDVTRILPFSVL